MMAKLKQLFYCVLLIILIYMFGSVLFYNNVNIFKVSFFGIIIGIIINIFLVFIFYKFLISKIKNEKIILIVIFSTLLIVQLLFCYIFVVKPSWDFGTIFNAVKKSIEGTRGLFKWDYFYRYDNNIPLAVFLRIIFGFFNIVGINNFLRIGILLNIVFIDISILYIYMILKMLFKKEKAYCFLIFSCMITPFITYSPIFYTDTLTLPFVSAGIYYFFKYIWKSNKIRDLIFCGLLIGVGSCFKITTIFILIAIFIFQIFNNKNIFDFKMIKTLLILVCITFIPLVLVNLAKGYKLDPEKVEKVKFPATHWIMMGLNEEKYGTYIRSDVDKTITYSTIAEKKEFNIEVINLRLKKYKENGKLINFYTNKLVKVWGDGSFYAPNKLRRYPLKEYDLKKLIIGNDKEAFLFNGFAQAQLIMMLFFTIVAILFRKKLKNKNEQCLFLCTVIIFGLILFFLIWESRSRYLVNYIPVLLLCLFIGIDCFYNWLNKKVSNKYEK